MQERVERYDRAAALLPLRLRRYGQAVCDEDKARAEELRLRVGQPLTILLPEGEVQAAPGREEAVVQPSDLEQLCAVVTDFARYAAADSLRGGYLSVRGGFRIGVCGTLVMREGAGVDMKHISSMAIRIAREKPGIAGEVAGQLFDGDRLRSTLILSPPGGGKTTLLRDLVRCLSEGTGDRCALRVGVVDERGELAACFQGVPQLAIGNHTDVLDGCPKALGIPILLRGMNPQVIAVDEITAAADLEAVVRAAGCGVSLLATVHAGNVEELRQKPLYRGLLESGVFSCALCIEHIQGMRCYRVEVLA